MGKALAKVLSTLEELKATQPEIEFVYKDLGGAKIFEQLDKLGTLFITIGFQGETALLLYKGNKVNVATVALYNEFGTEGMPARDFMRRSIRENLVELQAAVGAVFGEVANGRSSAVDAMAAVGKFMAQNMRDAIDTAATWAKKLEESTIKGKGHANPLVDTELMRKSITWAVRSGGALGSIVREGKA